MTIRLLFAATLLRMAGRLSRTNTAPEIGTAQMVSRKCSQCELETTTITGRCAICDFASYLEKMAVYELYYRKINPDLPRLLRGE